MLRLKVQEWEDSKYYVSVWWSELFGNGHQTRLMASGPRPDNASSRLTVTILMRIAAFVEYLVCAIC